MPQLRASTWSRTVVPLSLVLLPLFVGLWGYMASDRPADPARGRGIAKGSLNASTFAGSLTLKGASAEATSSIRSGDASNLPCDTEFDWSANREDSRIKLRGCIASDEERRTVLGIVKAHFPDLEIDDRMSQRALRREEKWLGAVGFALKQLNHLKWGAVRLDDLRLSIGGEARSVADHKLGAEALETGLPAGLSVQQANVLPPAAAPFVFKAEIANGTIGFTGNVPSDGSREDIRRLASELMPALVLSDQMVLASGQPVHWRDAVVAGLQGLSRLETGKLTISGVGVRIEGVARDQETAQLVARSMRRTLPAIYEANPAIKWKQTAASGSGPARYAELATGDVRGIRAVLVGMLNRITAEGRAQIALR